MGCLMLFQATEHLLLQQPSVDANTHRQAGICAGEG